MIIDAIETRIGYQLKRQRSVRPWKSVDLVALNAIVLIFIYRNCMSLTYMYNIYIYMCVYVLSANWQNLGSRRPVRGELLIEGGRCSRGRRSQSSFVLRVVIKK